MFELFTAHRLCVARHADAKGQAVLDVCVNSTNNSQTMLLSTVSRARGDASNSSASGSEDASGREDGASELRAPAMITPPLRIAWTMR